MSQKNREEILSEQEQQAKADLAELGEQGAGFGAGFANGALKRIEKFGQEKLENAIDADEKRTVEEAEYHGAFGKQSGTNFGLFLVLICIGGIILTSLLSRLFSA